ncbi:f3675c55-652c-4cde-840a-c3fe7ccc3abb [Thermothielavioides terrestris]|uniref:F3675c55-652c-4cde-840a-c3fe7ccc3abb n=1 Tax=Thermothielavioides terrestris TaxID=2587410 RepID=A0A3S5CXT6_9PEZI|nr:f3675c55-652c-4cde-840a-c3fe7ccc3abb [Thermothielavioides terrestris]
MPSSNNLPPARSLLEKAGPCTGLPVLLLRGWPSDILSYAHIAPALASAGYRVVVPYLRGNGPTNFQAALGADVVELLDAQRIPRVILASFDWGWGRGGWGWGPTSRARRPGGAAPASFSVNGYLVQGLDHASQPLDVPVEAGFWYLSLKLLRTS